MSPRPPLFSMHLTSRVKQNSVQEKYPHQYAANGLRLFLIPHISLGEFAQVSEHATD